MSSPFGMTVKDISNNLFPVVLTLALLVGITFVNIVPSSFRNYADSFPGRLVVVAVVIGTFHIAGWPSAIVAAVLALLLLAGGPQGQAIESFIDNKVKQGLALGQIEGFGSGLIRGKELSEGFGSGLIRSNAPLGLVEGFATINIDKSDKKVMWYDEEVLGREKKTKTEEVDTQALS
jgi:hypothetical protein